MLSVWKPCASGSQEVCYDGAPEVRVRSSDTERNLSLAPACLCLLVWKRAQGPYTELLSLHRDTDMGTVFKDR